MAGKIYLKTPASYVAVLSNGRDGEIATGSSDGIVLSVGLDDDGFEVVDTAVVGWDVKGFYVGRTVGAIGLRVVGL
jgi:hypothetical protein